MLDPYRMVVVNVVISLIVISAFFVYKYIKPRKTPSYPLIIFILSLLPLISLLRRGTYESGDLSLHTTRFLSFYNSLKSGILIPQWSHDLNAGYGYPLFIFVQTFPNHIASIFHLLGFSMIDSVKLLFAISFIISGLGVYYFLREFLPKTASLAGALLYLFAPYHLVDMHFRANPGEVLSFAFLPLTLLSLQKLHKKNGLIWVALLAINIAFLILSHPIAIVLIPFVLLYFLFLFFKKKDSKFLSRSIFGFTLGITLSAYYWLPEIVESKYTHQALYHKDVIFVGIKELLYSPWRFGFLYQGHYGELSFLLGYTQIFLLIIAVYWGVKNRFDKKIKPYALFFTLTFFLILFSMFSVSKPLWDIFPIFHNLQFSYRILVLESFIIAVIGAIAISKIKNQKIVFLIIIFTVFSTMLNWGNRKVIPEIDDTVLTKNIPYASRGVEGSAPSTPKWLDPKNPWQRDPVKEYLNTTNRQVTYKTLLRSPVKHTYRIDLKNNSEITENTLYFPGWEVYVDGRKIESSYDRRSGLITFDLKKGKHNVEVIFEETNDRKIAKNLTIFGIFMLICILFIYFLSKRKKFH